MSCQSSKRKIVKWWDGAQNCIHGKHIRGPGEKNELVTAKTPETALEEWPRAAQISRFGTITARCTHITLSVFLYSQWYTISSIHAHFEGGECHHQINKNWGGVLEWTSLLTSNVLHIDYILRSSWEYVCGLALGVRAARQKLVSAEADMIAGENLGGLNPKNYADIVDVVIINETTAAVLARSGAICAYEVSSLPLWWTFCSGSNQENFSIFPRHSPRRRSYTHEASWQGLQQEPVVAWWQADDTACKNKSNK